MGALFFTKGNIMLSGDKLKSLRIMHGLTVGQMAAGVGKSDRWIRLIESGQERPTEEVYVAYLETLYGRRKVPESKARKMKKDE